MRRGDFEDLVRRHLDGVLEPRGFRLTPQAPADVEVSEPAAVYEAAPTDFARRYPRLASVPNEVPCIDLWVRLDIPSQRIGCELEGASIEERMASLKVHDPVKSQAHGSNVIGQLTLLAARIAAMLDAAASEP